MSLKALMQKFGSLDSATATPATFATEKRNTTETVATVATVAVAAAEGRETAALPDAAPKAIQSISENGISAWRKSVRAFLPRTAIGNKLRRAALTFLDNAIAGQALELGWSEPELFGVLAHDDAEVIKLRADAKGVVPYVALAVWPGTRLEGFAVTHAVIVTGSGAILRLPRRAGSNVMPFWNSNAL
jgi:hypothetical protein